MNDREQAQKEYEEVRQWVLDEEDKVVERLKEKGQYLGGLDTQKEEFAYIYEERNQRIKTIRDKYNLSQQKGR